MTLKELAAGSGYEYLTCQVAAADSTEHGRTRLDYCYSAKGDAPASGSGLTGIKGPEWSDVVATEQMKSLLGRAVLRSPARPSGGRSGLTASPAST